jgi:hypothetical protein|tara:strand:+ start:183 stop:386 length:204 start_codon:yes stop_codon:yes gene_type:complete
VEDREFSKTIVLDSKVEDLQDHLSTAHSRIKDLEEELARSRSCACKAKKACKVDGVRALMAGNDYYE